MKRLTRSIYGIYLTVLLLAPTLALADSADVAKVQTFGQNIIQVLVTFSGLLAAGFFVIGGISYITSSGNPENLDRAKRTITYSAIGLAVSIGAFVLSSAISGIASAAFN